MPPYPKTGPSAYKQPPPRASAKTTKAKPKSTAKPSTSAQPNSHKVTVEDVSEDEAHTTSAKKKKKKPKKKKKKPAAAGTEGAENGSTATAPAASSPPVAAPAPAPAPSPAAAPPSTPKKEKKETPKSPPKVTRPPSIASQTAVPFGSSTTSLPIPQEQTAQSARTYLKSEGLLGSGKSKAKTRADPSTLGTVEEKKKKKGFFDRFRKDRSEEQEVEENEEAKQGSTHTWFKDLSKKAKTWMHQLLNTDEDEKKGSAPMKWENFVKLMREMGFTMDPSTAGSSVRFDPPDPRDKPISFHKPHPDPTLYPWKLKEYSRRLQRSYGWTEEDFYRAADN